MASPIPSHPQVRALEPVLRHQSPVLCQHSKEMGVVMLNLNKRQTPLITQGLRQLG